MQNPVICNLADNAWVVKKIYQNNMESLQSHIVSVCQKKYIWKVQTGEQVAASSFWADLHWLQCRPISQVEFTDNRCYLPKFRMYRVTFLTAQKSFKYGTGPNQ